jgi:drug/metabolite transporter (DMT)-like permease
MTILLAVLAAATNAGASVLQRKANLREVEAHRTGLAGLADLLRQPLWLAGISAVIVSFLLQAGALVVGELSEVQPLMALDLPFSLLLASLVFPQRLGRRVWVEIAVMTGGIAVFLYALHPTEGAPGGASGAAWAWGAGVTAGVVALLTGAGMRLAGVRRAALLGIASGVAFALTAVFIAAALAGGLSGEVFTRWQLYLVPVAGITAMVLLQEGLQAGPLVAVQPGVTLSDPVVAVVLGALLFDEGLRTGAWLIPEVIGAAAVAWGAVRLSRSSIGTAPQNQGGPSDDDGSSPAGRTAPGASRAAGRDPC